MGSLNAKQQAFTDAYLVKRNATEAAKAAGYSGKTAASQGARLLKHADVAAEIARRTTQAAEHADITVERTLAELARIGFSDIGACFNEDGSLKKLHEMSADARRAVASVEVTSIGGDEEGIAYLTKIKLWPKPDALQTIAKHLGMLVERVNVSGKVTLEKLVLQTLRKGAS